MWSGQDYENPFAQFLGYRGTDSAVVGTARFEEHYRCYPVAMMRGNERENVNFGGKIILPPSALEKLSSLHIQYPMLFRIANEANGKKTGAGVLEFIAEEGRVYLPNWMMKTLSVEQGQIVKITNTTLPTGHFVKIQPQSVEFLDISDPKAVLENAFRNFSTLTHGDVIEFIYNNKIFQILVLEIMPNAAGSISIVETDLEVDFAPPVGYEEPKMPRSQLASTPDHLYEAGEPIKEEERGWRSFRGAGNRLSGKQVPDTIPLPVNAVAPTGPQNMFTTTDLDDRRTAPAALNMPFGKLFFGYKIKPFGTKQPGASPNEGKLPAAFGGVGQTLRSRRTGGPMSSRDLSSGQLP